MPQIKTKEEYITAINELKKVFSAKKGTPKYERAQILEIMIEEYEDIHFPIPDISEDKIKEYLNLKNG